MSASGTHRLEPGAFDAVLFDAGGILVLPDPRVIAPLLEPYGGSVDVELHRRAHYAGMAAKSRAVADEGDWSSYNLAYVESIGVASHLLDRAAAMLDRTRTADLWRWPIPESVVALRRLQAVGVPMSVVSNASGQIEWVLSHMGVCQAGPGSGVEMRVVIDSHVVGVAKPDPRIFDFALVHHPEVDRSRILYVGDSVVMDVGGATEAGLRPVLLDPHDDHPELTADRIRDLSDLVGLFDGP
jgi:putative hydrolase of the HAD superfamily